MSSLFSKLKGGAHESTKNPSTNAVKRDPLTHLTPLDRLLLDAGPVRDDGSDKLFGMENFGSTCYYNSIVQCLYHSPPFRDYVLNFPSKTPRSESLVAEGEPPDTITLLEPSPTPGFAGSLTPLSPARTRMASSGLQQTPLTPKKSQSSLAINSPQVGRDDNKDSSEYKKKMALLTGPIIRMDQASADRYGMPEGMFTSLKHMFEVMSHQTSRTGVISPKRGTELVRSLNAVFSVPMHQDAHECLNFVLNEIVEELEKYAKQTVGSDSDADAAPPPQSQNTKWVRELFEGTLTSETKCLTCQKTSAREEAYLDISVDLGLYSSVTSCLLKFSEEEMLNERNKFHCDSCHGLQEAEKRMKIKKLPKILSLHLKRFTYTEDLQLLQKLHHRVAYPYYLRLFNLAEEAKEEEQDKFYELYAVVAHIGTSPYQGHYVSIIKTSEWGWLLFDDENVEPVDKSFVRNFFGSEQGLACAYVLFYQETIYEAAERDMDAEDKAAVIHPIYLGLKDSAYTPKSHAPVNGTYTTSTMPLNDHGEDILERTMAPPLAPSSAISNGHVVHLDSSPSTAASFSNVLPARKKSVIFRRRSTVQEKEVNSDKTEKRHLLARKENRRDSHALPGQKSRLSYTKDDAALASRTSQSTPGNLQGNANDDLFMKAVQPESRTNLDNSNGFFMNNIYCFKPTSKSKKVRPKLWSSKSKADLSGSAPPVQEPGDKAAEFASQTTLQQYELTVAQNMACSPCSTLPSQPAPLSTAKSNPSLPVHATRDTKSQTPDRIKVTTDESDRHGNLLYPQLSCTPARPELGRLITSTTALPVIEKTPNGSAEPTKRSKRSFLGIKR